MHNGSSTRKYRVPRSLLYSSAILSLTAATVYAASAFDVAAATQPVQATTTRAAKSMLNIVNVSKIIILK